jgi:hypothetical protein
MLTRQRLYKKIYSFINRTAVTQELIFAFRISKSSFSQAFRYTEIFSLSISVNVSGGVVQRSETMG